MHYFETRDVQNGTFKTRVLIAADDERVETRTLHSGTDIFVATIDFELAWQSVSGSFLLHATQFSGG
jgi:hypothetical protein